MSRKILHKNKAVRTGNGRLNVAVPTGKIGGPESAIAEAAYYRAHQRGFEPGHELDDWLAAEADLASKTLLRDVQPERH